MMQKARGKGNLREIYGEKRSAGCIMGVDFWGRERSESEANNYREKPTTTRVGGEEGQSKRKASEDIGEERP